ncbi:hypothetical protein GF352_03230 [archaeon]|nr:hypothetical protein [archaeon]
MIINISSVEEFNFFKEVTSEFCYAVTLNKKDDFQVIKKLSKNALLYHFFDPTMMLMYPDYKEKIVGYFKKIRDELGNNIILYEGIDFWLIHVYGFKHFKEKTEELITMLKKEGFKLILLREKPKKESNISKLRRDVREGLRVCYKYDLEKKFYAPNKVLKNSLREEFVLFKTGIIAMDKTIDLIKKLKNKKSILVVGRVDKADLRVNELFIKKIREVVSK